jgi:pimeloyl-ACP methyl ester carboxylesterase
MREKALLFGAARGLVGVLTEPAADVTADVADRPAVVLLNAGLLPRFGPFRLWVKLARRLAADGFPVLRFDLSGIGDSEGRKGALSFEETAQEDVRQALDHLERARGHRRFVLMGLCSGADNSFQAALRDERVVGLVLMDGYAYRTPEFYARYLARRLVRGRSWRRLGQVALDRVTAPLPPALRARLGHEPAGAVPDYVRAFPPREEVAAGLQRLVDRGVRLYAIYTSGMGDFYNHRAQLLHSFPDVRFHDRLALDYFAESNHTFTELRSQIALVEAVSRWARRAFPAHHGAVRAA